MKTVKLLNECLFGDLKKVIELLRADNSPSVKISILKKYKPLEQLITMIYDKDRMFNVTGDNVWKHYNSDKFSYVEWGCGIIETLIMLSERSITGNKALDICASILDDNEEYLETILDIFNKDLKCGINTKTLEKAYNKIISSFDVPLATTYKPNLCNFKKDKWFMSRKLDGVRCIAMVKDGKAKFYSRNGKEFLTLGKLKNHFEYAFKGLNRVFDGEICIVDKNGNEDFKNIMKQIRRKNYTIDNPKYFVFDSYSLDEFINKKGVLKYSEKHLDRWEFGTDMIEALPYTEIISQEDFEFELSTIPKHWEGVMLRKDTPTQFKRSNCLLKVKEFIDEEFTVIGTEAGTKVIDGIEQDVCASLLIKYKNSTVGVGSGLTDEQRINWYNDPDMILGKTITVKYFRESKNQSGKPSLRFPTLKAVHGIRREV